VRVNVYVEAKADRYALEALLQRYRDALRPRRHGVHIIAFDDKRQFLRKIGPCAARILRDCQEDRVAALPDLDDDDVGRLRDRMRRSVRDELQQRYQLQGDALKADLARFYPSALKHEMEMLLLAAWQPLGRHLGATLKPTWRQPAEEHNHTPQGRPKALVEDLFRTRSKRKRAYLDTTDAPAVLRQVKDIKDDLMYSRSSQLECPVFKGFLDWLGAQTGVPVYDDGVPGEA
jgi:hypothetical protein